jgi:ABC-type sugar transport system ATPase subunit
MTATPADVHSSAGPSSEILLEVRGLSKTYGRSVALEPTDITVRAGSVHGFLGKNGAGKSTLVGLIAGSIQPTSGSVHFRGRDITALNLAQRRSLGIHLLGQHAEVVAALSVAENLVMPDYPKKLGLIDRGAMRSRARALLDRYNLDFDVDQPAGLLSVPDQRRLSIVRTLVDDGALAMLDEPTTALSQAERRDLFNWVRDLNAAGQTFIFISHFNNEIQEICNACTVLRDGRLVSDGEDPRAMTSAQMSELVTGASVDEFRRESGRHDEPLVELSGLVVEGAEEVNLTLGRGEIVGFVGLPGSGAREVARALAGLRPILGGSVIVDGRASRIRSVKDAVRSGIAYLTDDRIGEGLVGPFSVKESLRLGNWPLTSGLIDNRKVMSTYQQYHQRLSFRVSGPDQPVEELSGGNQQKILLGRLLALQPKVGTKEEVHRLIDELTEQGLAVILLAYDTDEMVRMVDRVVAFSDGRVSTELTGDDITVDNILNSLAHATPVSMES